MVINMLVDNDICISSALEDYLESIYEISKQKTSVRITDIALALKISKPSVNRAVNTLKKQGLVSHEPYGDIILTEKGFELGEAVYHRHTMIKKFLVNVLHIPEDDAEKEACQIEHNISQNTVEKMKSFMENSKGVPKMNSSAYSCTLEFIFTKSAKASRISKIGLPLFIISVN